MKKKARKRVFSLRNYFTVITLIIMVVTLLVANAGAYLLDWIFGFSMTLPITVAIPILSIILGTGITAVTSKFFLAPITRLSQAMKEVADGKHEVKLTDEKNPVTEITDSYDSFNTMTGAIAAAEELQNEFISNVSHEFKTPINAIEGYAMLLQGDPQETAEQEEYIQKILLNTRRLSDLVGNILLLSKLESRDITAEKTSFRLDEQIRQAIVQLEPQWEPKNIEFDVEMESINCVADEKLLQHVWLNLVGNAVKFAPQDGFIEIRLREDVAKESIIFTILDNGQGVPPGQEERIFERFYQADSSHKAEGNGLGLALVKRAVEMSGGTVSAENVTEGGCKFTVTLPLPEEDK
ncbi:MAG: HAMP domain-containing histidine kinase [Lachnospiraceae bacterium]|nr:HAMP domain-containing histidine kinase [Lachnospiraceae bacterium]